MLDAPVQGMCVVAHDMGVPTSTVAVGGLVRDPLVQELGHILSTAWRHVAVEQRDPSMGANGRFDISESASDVGGTVVAPLRDYAGFRGACTSEPCLSAEQRHANNVDTQYGRGGRRSMACFLALPCKATGQGVS